MNGSLFDLHASVLADYRNFVRSFFTIADEHARIPRAHVVSPDLADLEGRGIVSGKFPPLVADVKKAQAQGESEGPEFGPYQWLRRRNVPAQRQPTS